MALSILLGSPAALAADPGADNAGEGEGGVEQIIVTANRRAENLQTVPTSMSAITAEDIKNLGVQNTTDIAKYMPGVQLMTVNANSDNFFSIRGATQNDYAEHEESPVAVYMDGVYLSQAAGTSALLFDTDRVEVLRGPQGTLFGRNATAGLVQFISKAPTDHPDGYFETSYGNFNSNHTELAFGDGFAPGWSFRVSAASDYMDPYLKNVLYPDKGGGGSNSRAARLQLRYENDSLDATLNLHGVTLNVQGGLYKFVNVYADPNNHDLATIVPDNADPWLGVTGFTGLPVRPNGVACDGCDILGYKDPKSFDFYTSAADIQGYNQEHTAGATLTLHGHFDGLTLTSITDFTKYYKSYNEDSESTPQDLTEFYTAVDTKQYSQELHIDNGSEHAIRWVAGLYYLQISGTYEEGSGQGAQAFALFPYGEYPGNDQRYTIQTKSWSEFAQAEFDLPGRLTLTTGARVSTEHKDFDYKLFGQVAGFQHSPYVSPDPYFFINPSRCGVPGGELDPATCRDAALLRKTDWSAKVALDWHLSQDVMPYVSWNRGIKAGGFSAAGNADLPVNLYKFDEEVVYTWEAGVKSELLNHKMRVNADVFMYNYIGYQGFNTVDAVYTYITNNPGTMRGGELELTLAPIKGLVLHGGLALLDAWIKNIVLPDGTAANVRPAQAPKTTINAGVDYTWNLSVGSFSLGSAYSYRSAQFYELSDDPASEQRGYGLLDLHAEYTTLDGHWSFRAYGNNVTGVEYLGNDIVGGSTGFGQGSPGLPATYGLRVAYHL